MFDGVWGASGVPGRCKGLRPLTRFGGVFVVFFLAGVTGRDRRPATRSCGNARRSCAPAVRARRITAALLCSVGTKACALCCVRFCSTCLSIWCRGRRPDKRVGAPLRWGTGVTTSHGACIVLSINTRMQPQRIRTAASRKGSRDEIPCGVQGRRPWRSSDQYTYIAVKAPRISLLLEYAGLPACRCRRRIRSSSSGGFLPGG